MDRINLDKIAAENAQEITQVLEEEIGRENKNIDAKTLDILTTKALGVLQEQGIYANILFLLSRSGKESDIERVNGEEICARYITKTLVNLLRIEPFENWGCTIFTEDLELDEVIFNKQEILDGLSTNNLLEDMDKLFLIRNLYEQILIYTRYSAKAGRIKEEIEDEMNNENTAEAPV